MVTRLSYFFIIINLHHVITSPLRQKKSPRDLQTNQYLYSQVPVLHNIGSHNIYVHHKRPTLLAPIPLSQLYYHKNVHVIPLVHNSVHINNKDTVYHQTVTHETNVTQLIPVFVPIHSHIVPLHDLSVIPLRHQEQKAYRAMEMKQEEEEPLNQFRNFYGGYGTGLFFGGHGAGHGFYAYGK